MKINSVELVNFRNHREAKYEFKEGINLILGENGSGKTSILDAIGMTLFGMKSRSSNSEVLSEGCKTGHVKVCFTGNDGMDYLVVKKFPAGNVTLSEESSKNSITSRQEVFAKISELTGVVSANGDIFENVIVAQQNMLTGVFAGKSGDRERIFNSVFGTEIYRKMYDGLLKSSIEKYQADVNDTSSRIDVLSSGLKDAGIILAEVESAAEKVEAAEAARMKCEKDYNESEKLLRVYESAKSEKIRMKQLVESTGKRISDASLRLKNAEAELLSALKFASIAASLKGDHDECETLRKKIDSISGEIAKLEETEKQKNLLLRESSEAQKNAGAAEASAVGLSERIEETIAIGKKIKDEISEFEKRLEEARKECFGANELKSAKEKIFSDFEAKFEVFHGKRNEAAKLEFRHEQMKKGAQDCDLLRKKLEESRGRYLLLEKDIRTRDGHLSDIAKLDALLDELAAAEKKLSGKTCPFLREQCKNLSDGKSTSDYFESRRSDIEKDRHALQLKINGFSGINEKISAELSFRGSCESELESALKNDKDMADCLAQKEMCSKEAAVAFSQIVRICASGGIDDKYFDEDKCDELRDVLRSSAIKAKGELDACAQKVEMLAANLAAKNAERDAEVKRYSEFKRRHDEALVSVKNEKAKIDKLSTEIASMDILLKPLDGLKSERQSMNEREKTLSLRSREFIAASAAAASAGEKQRQIDADKALLESLALEKKEAEGKADGIVYDEARHSEQTARGDVLKKYLDEAVSSQTEIKIAYAAALNMQKENAKRLDEISTLKALFDEKNSKFILARNFREQIKDLGPYIAKMRMMSVAKSATENYRKMTGRAERILWESGDEQYQVFLVSAGVRRPYHMLSGGEQVAAALAIRAALAGELTECRFAVFDEPTVNLDAEKREALSVSLNEMLKGLSQALVVTHDSVFREMATNVIELSRRA